MPVIAVAESQAIGLLSLAVRHISVAVQHCVKKWDGMRFDLLAGMIHTIA